MRTADQAVAVAHAARTYPVGYCLRFVRERWAVGPLYSSAIEAWNGARFKHPGDRNPPKGAPCYYAGGRYGHIVIHCPPAHPGIRSTDVPWGGNVSDADIGWCERNWGYRYLGWTEDLNGIRLPLGDEEDDEMTDEDWKKLRRIVGEEVAANNAAATDAVWAEQVEVTKPDGTKDKRSARQLIRETWQRVAKL